MSQKIDQTAQALLMVTKRWVARLWEKKFGISKKEIIPAHKWQILKGDMVEVVEGPHKGQQGKVLKVMRRRARVVVDGVAVRIWAVGGMSQEGKKLKRLAMPIWAKHCQLVCPITQEATTIRYRYRKLEGGGRERIRVSEHGAVIEKPSEAYPTKVIHPPNERKDTATQQAQQRTWIGPWEYYTEEQREAILEDAADQGLDPEKVPDLIRVRDRAVREYLELLPPLPKYMFIKDREIA